MTSSGPALELTVLLARVALEEERCIGATPPPPLPQLNSNNSSRTPQNHHHHHNNNSYDGSNTNTELPQQQQLQAASAGGGGGASLDGFVSWINSQAPTLCHSGSASHTPTGNASAGSSTTATTAGGSGGLIRVGSGPISVMHTPPRHQQQSTTTTPYGNTIPTHIASAFAAAPSNASTVSAGGKHSSTSASREGGRGLSQSNYAEEKSKELLSAPSPASSASYVVSSSNNHRSTPQQHHRGATPQLDPSAAAYEPSTPPPAATSLLSNAAGCGTAPHTRQLFAPMQPAFPQTPPPHHHGGDSGAHFNTAATSNSGSAVRRTPLHFSTPKHGGSSAGTSPQHGPLSRPMSTLSQPFVLALSADATINDSNNSGAGFSPSPVGFPPQGSLSTTPHHFYHNNGGPNVGGIMAPSQPHFYGHSNNPQSQSPIRQVEVHRGRVVEAAKDQAGCRTLQRLFDATPFESPEIQSILAELAPSVTELMADAYGNFLVQKILECAPDAVRLQITTTVAPALAVIATTPHGTFAVQKLVESLRSEEEAAVVCNGLGQNVPLLLNDVNGGHVVQKVLQCISPSNRQFLFDGIATHVTQVCNHRQGCCVVQKCIDQATLAQFQQVEAAAMHQALSLMSDPFGNYVMSRILDRGAQVLNPQQRVQQLQTIVDTIATAAADADARVDGGSGKDDGPANRGAGGQLGGATANNTKGYLMVRLCRDKFSSNVVEKLFKATVGLPPFDTLMGLILATEQRPLDILFEGCGNYVIQAALSLSPVPLPRQLLRGGSGGSFNGRNSGDNTDAASSNNNNNTSGSSSNRFDACHLAKLVEILLPYMASISQQNFGKKVEAAVADALVRLFQSGYTLPHGWVLPHVLQAAVFQHHPQAAPSAQAMMTSSPSSHHHHHHATDRTAQSPYLAQAEWGFLRQTQQQPHPHQGGSTTPVQQHRYGSGAASPSSGLNAGSPEWTPQKAAAASSYRRR